MNAGIENNNYAWGCVGKTQQRQPIVILEGRQTISLITLTRRTFVIFQLISRVTSAVFAQMHPPGTIQARLAFEVINCGPGP